MRFCEDLRHGCGPCLLSAYHAERLACLAGGMSAAASRVAMQAVAAPEAPSQTAAVAEAPRELAGFELVRDEFVHEYDSHVRTYRHQRTGVAPIRMLDQSPLFDFDFEKRVPQQRVDPASWA